MGDRKVKSDERKKIWYKDATNLYGWAMSESLTNGENKFGKNVKVEDILTIPEDSDICYFVEIDLSYPDNIRETTKMLPFVLKIKSILKITLVVLWLRWDW